MNLDEKLKSFVIPAMRRDTSKLENILWLGRNLPINNLNNFLLGEVMAEINKIGKTMLKDIDKS